MRTLQKILEDAEAHSNGTFVALSMSTQSKKQLGDFVKDALNLEQYDDPSTYHITIIASSTPLPQAADLTVGLVQAQPDHYELFNTRAGTKCLVLKVKSPKAEQLNKLLIQQGGKSAFPDYNPHITLCFDYKGTIDTLVLPNFSLTFDHLVVKPNDVNYIPPTVSK